jgi:hypothetical protein
MRRTSGTGRLAIRCAAVSLSLLALRLSAVPAFAEIPDCLLVEARAEPSGNGKYDHSLIFINACDVRMFLTARYADEPDSAAGSELVGTGERLTITLGISQPSKAFRAHYDVRFGRGRDVRSHDRPATRTARATLSSPKKPSSSSKPPRSLASSEPRGDGLPLGQLCDRALRQLFRLQGLSETDSALKDRVSNCPSRVNRDPQKRRAELECLLGASTGEDVRTCFGAR